MDAVVAADGGVRHAADLGLTVTKWVGDGDSVEADTLEALHRDGVTVIEYPTEKDETDTEAAIRWAFEMFRAEVILLGGLGGPRLDHALANLGMLAQPISVATSVRLYDEHAARVSLMHTLTEAVTRAFEGRVGDVVSLVPLGRDAFGVTTEGLQYPLRGETLEFGRSRGVSNIRTQVTARITLEKGALFVIETPVIVAR